MRLRCAFLLRHLGDGLVAHALLGPGGVDGDALPGGLHEGEPVALVHVVGDGEALEALLALRVQPGPQVFRVVRVAGAERTLGRVAPEYHVAMQVAAADRERVLVSAEGRERPRVVVALGGGDDLSPGVGDHVGPQQFVIHGGQPADAVEDVREGRGYGGKRVGVGMAVGGARRVELRLVDAEVFGVVAHHQEIERMRDLERAAVRVRDRLALREFVGVVRRGAHVHGHERVHRERGVDVGVPEPRLAVGPFDRPRGRGERGCKQGDRGFLHAFVTPQMDSGSAPRQPAWQAQGCRLDGRRLRGVGRQVPELAGIVSQLVVLAKHRPFAVERRPLGVAVRLGADRVSVVVLAPGLREGGGLPRPFRVLKHGTEAGALECMRRERETAEVEQRGVEIHQFHETLDGLAGVGRTRHADDERYARRLLELLRLAPETEVFVQQEAVVAG